MFSTLGPRQGKSFSRKFLNTFLKELLCYKRSDEKWSRDVAYSFNEWKLSSVNITYHLQISICILLGVYDFVN